MILEKIFFSYSRADASDFALKLALDLKKTGFNIWIDQEDIRAGSEWDLEIEKALETCDCVLFIETEKSVASNNVLDEVYYALEEKKKVIPLILVDSKTPFRLQRLQHIDFSKDYNSGLALLINELKNSTAEQAFLPDDVKPLTKPDKPFYKKNAGFIIIASLAIIIAAALIYTLKNNKTTPAENSITVKPNDTITGNKKLVGIEPNDTAAKDVSVNKATEEKKIKPASNDKKVSNSNNNIVGNPANKPANVNETFAGDWKLVDVQPKAQSSNGYLKIESIDGNKVSIKSYVQFYYFKTNDTSFLNVFNAFAGCSPCNLENDMKIQAEDIAVGSQYYKINGKSGDTTMNAGANKSIHASVTLHLINNTTTIIKVQQPATTELSNGLILQPFVYTFRFTKVDD